MRGSRESAPRPGPDAIPDGPAGFTDTLGPGAPLDAHARQRMESAFGADFSDVQVHTGTEAGEAARRYSAQALTVGSHIAFAPGNYRPGTPVGDAMLAHELAHTLQQGGAGVADAASETAPPLELASSALEDDADFAAIGALGRLSYARASAAASLGFPSAQPALRAGLRVQRCSCGGGDVAPQLPPATFDGQFLSHNFDPRVDSGLVVAPSAKTKTSVSTKKYRNAADVVAVGGTRESARQWEAGFIQTLFGTRFVRNYALRDGTRYVSRVTEIQEPHRDGGTEDYPFYTTAGGTPFRDTDRPVHVSMNDTPFTESYQTIHGGKGQLVGTEGADTFRTWLVVRHFDRGTIIPLEWNEWTIDWQSEIDPATRTGHATGPDGGGAHVGQRGLGQGPLPYVIKGHSANEALTDPTLATEVPWKGPPVRRPTSPPLHGASAPATTTPVPAGGGKAAPPGDLIAGLGPNAPLDAQARQRMESAFGADFSDVLVHTGAEAGAAARRHSAQALTVGKHIAFAPGNYRPGTLVGDAMLAHELAHTLQQRRGGAAAEVANPPVPAVASVDTALETDAEHAATGAMLRVWGTPAGVTTAGFRDPRPALGSAMRLQRCSCGGGQTHPAATTTAAIPFQSSNVKAGVGGPLHFYDEPDHHDALTIRPNTYKASGDVESLVDSDQEAQNWQAGYTQTALDGKRVHNYEEIATGKPKLREIIEVTPPSFDGEPQTAAPWYHQIASFGAARSKVHVGMEDTPTDRAGWLSTDQKLRLASTSGADHFCSWLIVKHRSSDDPIFLNWDAWEVDWSTTIDWNGKVATPHSGPGAKADPPQTGHGPKTPVLKADDKADLFNERLNSDDNRHVGKWDGSD